MSYESGNINESRLGTSPLAVELGNGHRAYIRTYPGGTYAVRLVRPSDGGRYQGPFHTLSAAVRAVRTWTAAEVSR